MPADADPGWTPAIPHTPPGQPRGGPGLTPATPHTPPGQPRGGPGWTPATSHTPPGPGWTPATPHTPWATKGGPGWTPATPQTPPGQPRGGPGWTPATPHTPPGHPRGGHRCIIVHYRTAAASASHRSARQVYAFPGARVDVHQEGVVPATATAPSMTTWRRRTIILPQHPA